MDHFFSYFLICFLLVISPGPNTFLIFNTAAAVGKSDSIFKILGLFTATFAHGLFAILVLLLILIHSPLAFMTIKIIGAGYLFYLGAKSILSLFQPQKNCGATKQILRKKTMFENFNEGFSTQILNSKISLFYLAVFPQFIRINDNHPFSTGILLITVHAFMIAMWFIFMTFSIKLFTRQARKPKLVKIISFICGVALIYYSFFLFFQPSPKV